MVLSFTWSAVFVLVVPPVGFMNSVSCDVNPESCDETLDRRTVPTTGCWIGMVTKRYLVVP